MKPLARPVPALRHARTWPPRGGRDVRDGWWLTGLGQAEQLRWTRAAEWYGQPSSIGHAGRGHVACRLGRTGTVLAFSGGRPSDPHCVAFVNGQPRAVTVANSNSLPVARAFGGGCGLPDGTMLIYGGWHQNGRSFSNVWAAYAGDKATDFVARLSAGSERTNEEEEEEDDDDMERRFLPLLARLGGSQVELRQLLGLMGGRPFVRLQEGDDDSEDEDDEEQEEDEEVERGEQDRIGQDTGDEGEAHEADGDAVEQAFADEHVDLEQAFRFAEEAAEQEEEEAEEEGEEEETDDEEEGLRSL